MEVLDALSIGISLFRGDFSTASSVRFLLGLGELLEEWTHKKSVSDLAQCMSLSIDRVWLKTPQGEILTPLPQVQTGDQVCVRLGGQLRGLGIRQVVMLYFAGIRNALQVVLSRFVDIHKKSSFQGNLCA